METLGCAAQHFALMGRVSSSLGTLPAELLEHHYEPHSFGSWWFTLRYKRKAMRVVFDGREADLRLEIQTEGQQDWRVISTVSDLKSASQIEQGLSELLSRLGDAV
jgi:hypothetical protein